ncbi:MAG: glutamine synthetase family protein [Alphaproteobacteria bacterium]|nr:glutamine synthetase family protein [Alphaproteobacteria bacterium]
MSLQDFEWLNNSPDITHVTIAACDLNGILRGKRVPTEQAKKLLSGGLKLPFSGLGIDVWGEDLHEHSSAYDNGDSDGVCKYTGRGVLPVNWMQRPAAFIPVTLLENDGRPFAGEGRVALERICQKFADRGLTPVVATELEFYLYNLEDGLPTCINSPVSGKAYDRADLLSIEQLDHLDDFLHDLHVTCQEQNINADTMISENAASQYEVNLLHVADPVRAADDTVLFKRLIKGVARKHGMGATFMAKPFGDQAGNSMHVHFSLIDENGKNVFDDGTDRGSDSLRHAIGGLMNHMRETALIFAPHYNSYRRYSAANLSPSQVTWGYENRTVAIRVPDSPNEARRIEHRVAGADANPYLILTAILGAALDGIENQTYPGEPVTGWGYDVANHHDDIPTNWSDAINLFAHSDFAKRLFDPLLHKLFVEIKTYEIEIFRKQISAFEYHSYLENV